MYRRNKEYHKINRIKSYGVCRTYFQLNKNHIREFIPEKNITYSLYSSRNNNPERGTGFGK